jgi:hypothetical protein
MRKAAMLAALLGVVAGQVLADSIVTNVTTSNIGVQPLHFTVHSQRVGDGLLQFVIVVAGAQDSVSPIRSGTLSIWEGTVTPCDHTGQRPNHPVVLASCAVHEQTHGGELQYTFLLHPKLVAQATFMFCNSEPHGMPSFDGYDFVLGGFDLSER